MKESDLGKAATWGPAAVSWFTYTCILGYMLKTHKKKQYTHTCMYIYIYVYVQDVSVSVWIYLHNVTINPTQPI